MHKSTNPEKLIQYIRSGLVEQEHFGFVILTDREGKIIERVGEDRDYPHFLRSCAKPLQASLLIDYELDKKFDLTEEEIAICCASHAGEEIHVDVAINFFKKIGLSENYLKCGLHKPISKTEKEKLIISGKSEHIFQNNCIGKHIMMLALCKVNNWDIETYYEINHPLQIAIKEKINSLCRVKNDYPMTKDGCGVPIMSMPLRKMPVGFLNLFCDPKYKKITDAFINYPYIIGGEDRLDTKIMTECKNLIAKVGAGGLCIVVNLEKEEAFIVKISDTDMKAREIITIDTLKNLHWADIQVSRDIKTLHGEIIGTINSIY